MTKNKIIELINKDLDGVISHKEKDRLETYLARDHEAKQYQEELRELSNILSRVEKVEPDANLKKLIMNRISARKHVVEEKRSLSGIFASKMTYKYALAFSGGLVVGLIVFLMLGGPLGEAMKLDHTDLTGSIILKDAAGAFETADKFEISETNIHANVAAKVADKLILLEANISTISETEFSLQFDSEDLQFDAFRQSGDKPTEMTLKGNEIKFRNAGRNQFVFVFKDKTARNSHIVFKVDAGTLPIEKVLSTGKEE